MDNFLLKQPNRYQETVELNDLAKEIQLEIGPIKVKFSITNNNSGLANLSVITEQGLPGEIEKPRTIYVVDFPGRKAFALGEITAMTSNSIRILPYIEPVELSIEEFWNLGEENRSLQ